MNNIIYKNTATNSYYYGICIRNSDYNTISRNNLAGSRILCILEENCEGNVFRNNESCDYGETDQAIPSYNLFLLVGIILIALLFILRNRYKKGKII